jgi:hypothetical protein
VSSCAEGIKVRFCLYYLLEGPAFSAFCTMTFLGVFFLSPGFQGTLSGREVMSGGGWVGIRHPICYYLLE